MKNFFVVLILIFVIIIAGCSKGPIIMNEDKGPILYSFTDATGRKLEFIEKPRKIVSLNTAVDEILLDMVSYDRITALTHLADDSTLCCAYEKAKKVSGRVYGSNMEQILSLGPDLVIIADWSGSDYINSLRQYGIKLAVLHTPNSYEEIMQYIQNVALLVGEPEKGAQMIRDVQHRGEVFRHNAVAAYGENGLRKVLVLSTMGSMGQKGTFNDICYLAGVKNALADLDVPQGMVVSDERIMAADPDVIILPSWDYYKSTNMGVFREKVMNNPVYKNIKAIRQGRVYQVHDQYLYSTSQYTIRAVEEIARVVYPELYGEAGK